MRRGLGANGARGNGHTAFVLSGGGSLGAVQVGMLRALFETGIRPDMLIGTSVGAVNAAWVAGRPEPDGMGELEDIWLGLRRQDVFPLSPVTGVRGLLGRANHFISNSSLRRILETHIPYRRLEEAAIPVHIVATELKSGRATILASGPAVPALLASCAIPAVFRPVEIGGRDYVDGGALSHRPAPGLTDAWLARSPDLVAEPARQLAHAFGQRILQPLHQGAATATSVDDPPHADGDRGDRKAGRQECDRRQLAHVDLLDLADRLFDRLPSGLDLVLNLVGKRVHSDLQFQLTPH